MNNKDLHLTVLGAVKGNLVSTRIIEIFFNHLTDRDDAVKMNFISALSEHPDLMESFMNEISVKGGDEEGVIFNRYNQYLIQAGSYGVNEESTPQEVGVRAAFLMNLKAHAEIIGIPLFSDFVIDENDGNDPHVIVARRSNQNGILEMLTADGPLSQGETFEDRIDLVNRNVINYLKTVSNLNSEKNIFFLKDFQGGTFNFKVYIQDTLVTVDGKTKIARSVNAFFIEPRFNDFYELTMQAGAFDYPSENIVLGEYNQETDRLTKVLESLIDVVMEKMAYREHREEESHQAKIKAKVF